MRISRLLALSILCVTLLMSSVAFADTFEVRGTVASIDAAAQSFVLKDANSKEFKVITNADTDFEIEYPNSNKISEDTNFAGIKAGDTVEVDTVDEVTASTVTITAEDVTIYR